MTPAQLALRRVEVRLLDRLELLEQRLAAGEDVWSAYGDAARTLATIARETVPGEHGELLTTAQMAARLNVSTKTILRRRKAGQLEAVQFGSRGRAALRWPGREAAGR